MKTLKDKIENYGRRSFFASETMKQLKMGQGQMMMMCWAVHDIRQIPDKEYEGECKGIYFKVAALKFTGTVVITLAWDDTYTVRFINGSGEEKEDLKLTMVYFDQLSKYIDKVVETD